MLVSDKPRIERQGSTTVYVRTGACMYICMDGHMCGHMYTRVCMCVCVCVYVYVCECV